MPKKITYPIKRLEKEVICSHNWEKECLDLRSQCCQMQSYIDNLEDQNSKLHLQFEQLLKEKSDLERKMGFLEGQIEAYQFCVNIKR